MDKKIVFSVLIVIFAGMVFWGFQSGFFTKNPGSDVTATPLPEGIVLFFGEDCPHCKIVEDFITQNKIADKVSFTNLEVPFGLKSSPQLMSNAKLAIKLAQGCNMDVSNGISIPFLYDGKNCLLGQDDVINFFKEKAGIK